MSPTSPSTFLDLQYVIGGDAILLAARFDDCEHFLPFAVRSALLDRLRRSGRLFVSLRVQKASGAEKPHAGLRAVPNRSPGSSQGGALVPCVSAMGAAVWWCATKPAGSWIAGRFGLVSCLSSRYLVRRAGNGGPRPRRGGRVVECTALEMRHGCKPIGGSNPSLSAKCPIKYLIILRFMSIQHSEPQRWPQQCNVELGGSPSASACC